MPNSNQPWSYSDWKPHSGKQKSNSGFPHQDRRKRAETAQGQKLGQAVNKKLKGERLGRFLGYAAPQKLFLALSSVYSGLTSEVPTREPLREPLRSLVLSGCGTHSEPRDRDRELGNAAGTGGGGGRARGRREPRLAQALSRLAGRVLTCSSGRPSSGNTAAPPG